MTGIEDLGDSALASLVELMPSLGIPDSKKCPDGDAYFVLPDDPTKTRHWLEVKGGKPNQVRPVNMLTLVFTHNSTWYVIPAHDMLGFACMLQRGQHGYDPIDCCQLNVSGRLDRFRVERAQVPSRIEAAVRGKVAAKTAIDAILEPYKAAAAALRVQLEAARSLARSGLGSWSTADLDDIASQSKSRARKKPAV